MKVISVFIALSILRVGCSHSDERIDVLEDQIELIKFIDIGGRPSNAKIIYPENGDTLTCRITLMDVFTPACKQKLVKNAFHTVAFKTRGYIEPELWVKILISEKVDAPIYENAKDGELEVSIVKIEGRYWEVEK